MPVVRDAPGAYAGGMDGADHQPIREAVARLCADFPGEYWRRLDAEAAYPTAFVEALTRSGFLAALIPEAYGGAGLPLSAAAAILEEVQRAGCNGAACHAQMYVMGTPLRHGSEEQKRRWLPQIASGAQRLQAFGVTEPGSGSDTLSLKTFARREGETYASPARRCGPAARSTPTSCCCWRAPPRARP